MLKQRLLRLSMAEVGIYSFSQEEDWDDIFNNPPTICTPKNAELDMDLASSEWLVNEHHTHQFSISSSPFTANLHAIEEYLMDSHLHDHHDIDNHNVGMEEDDHDQQTGSQLELDDDILGSIEMPQDLDMMDCFTDQGPQEFMVLNDDSIQSDSITNTNISSSRSVGTTIKESSSVDNGGSQEGKELNENDYKGLRLLHLLTACAEAISQESQDLAEVILLKLSKLVSATGSTMERVAYYLFHTLHSKIEKKPNFSDPTAAKAEQFLGALKLLHQVYPYIRVAHFTANQCILEALAAGASNMTDCPCLHIIDFDIMEGIQWPPLMEALKNADYAIGHMKITAIKWENEEHRSNSLLYSTGKQTGKRLAEYAKSLGIPFSFEEKELQDLKEISISCDDIVAANCMWGLPHMIVRAKLHVWEFMETVGHINVDILTVAMGPQGVDGGSPGDFVDRFSSCLKNLCAVFDSLEAGLPEHGLARAIVERIFFGPKMCRFLVGHYEECKQDFVLPNVGDIPVKCGFVQGVMSKESVMHAEYVVSCCSEGGRFYGLELVGDNQLVLKWGSTPLLWVSTWDSP
ncbi:hypothetical protein SUGI_0131540 [Cryptomeria japonica]|nr:hypothetical protein SUGI_0131540 [Cryptomeria japonica]